MLRDKPFLIHLTKSITLRFKSQEHLPRLKFDTVLGKHRWFSGYAIVNDEVVALCPCRHLQEDNRVYIFKKTVLEEIENPKVRGIIEKADKLAPHLDVSTLVLSERRWFHIAASIDGLFHNRTF